MRRAALVFLLLLPACTPPKKEIVGLRTFDYLGGDIRSGSIQYQGSPPAGGPYNALWQTCGVYAALLYDEYAVHSLARGAIWVTYKPGLDAAEIAKLKTLLATPLEIKQDDQTHTITAPSLLSPRANLPAPIVMTAWNAQILAQSADDENLKLFLTEYVRGDTAPEKGASCAGGFGGTR